MPLSIPKKPVSMNTEEHHKTIGDIVNFLSNMNGNGLAVKGFKQSEVDEMKESNQAGKFIFNEDTGKINVSEINPSTKTITWKAL